MTELEPEGQELIDAQVKDGKTILACRTYRDLTGGTLIQARDYVFGRRKDLVAFRDNAAFLERHLQNLGVPMSAGDSVSSRKQQLALIDRIMQIVDCGCCSTNGEAVARVAEWWLSMNFGEPVTDGETSAITDAYNFYNFDHGYHPARRQRDGT